MEYRYFPTAIFSIFHVQFSLMLIYCRPHSICTYQEMFYSTYEYYAAKTTPEKNTLFMSIPVWAAHNECICISHLYVYDNSTFLQKKKNNTIHCISISRPIHFLPLPVYPLHSLVGCMRNTLHSETAIS